MKINKQNISKMIIGSMLVTSLIVTPALAKNETNSINSTSLDYILNDNVVEEVVIQIQLFNNMYNICINGEVLKTISSEDLNIMLDTNEEYVTIDGYIFDKNTLEKKVTIAHELATCFIEYKDGTYQIKNNEQIIRQLKGSELQEIVDETTDEIVFIETNENVFISFSKEDIIGLLKTGNQENSEQALLIYYCGTGLIMLIVFGISVARDNRCKKTKMRDFR